MIGDALAWICVVLAWIAVGYTLPGMTRRRADPTYRAFWLSLVFLALSLSVLAPEAYAAIDAFTGIANLARLLGNALILVAGWQVQAFLFHLNYPDQRAEPRVRLSGLFLVAALVLLAVFFGLAPVHQEAADFVGRYADAPFVLEYRLVFLAYLGWALVSIAYLSLRYANLVERPILRLSLRLDGFGGVLGLGYVVNETLRVVLPHFFSGKDPILHSVLLTQAFEASSVTVMLFGCTMPAWGPRVGLPRLLGWLTRYRTYRRLAPLWQLLYQASPEIALSPPRSITLDNLNPWDLSFRLHRRVIEIRDGFLALRPYLDREVAEEIRRRCKRAGLSSGEIESIASALELLAASEAKRDGRPARHPGSTVTSLGGSDLAGEVAALEGVADALANSPIVRAELAWLRGGELKQMETS